MYTIIGLFIASMILFFTRNADLFYHNNLGKKPKYVCIAVVIIGAALDLILKK